MTPKTRSIFSLLNEVKNGEIGLPDLQRDFVWKEEDIRLLLDSIMRRYPFGLLCCHRPGGVPLPPGPPGPGARGA